MNCVVILFGVNYRQKEEIQKIGKELNRKICGLRCIIV